MKKNKLLYELFSEGKGEEFKTLTALLKGVEFTDNDGKLLEEIIKIDKKLEDLILNKSGLVDDDEITTLLSKAAAHFNIINLAFDGQITGDVERFEEYVYPKELDNKIEARIKTLQQRLKELDKGKI
jgi:hypothetical protein